ncbi:S-adenosyl-L-methionine-dependent methyltransferases superfamily protein isoform 1 [Hibiscus syriacus]|uniref:S-adenosyl-L-methionine-dependent methyltransferases superfamily protein isoform 1 n=1 Tax=Hibiscus syriacus TaxID=106335 RepID=A0A6A2YUQ7_HIBSY|nr:S-adenosyl-L-methionine-dependent methyltransferases superfamily protein isoform 1 [Hibiscus syriacus]
MNSYRQVESTLKEILEVIKPLQEDWVTRFKIIDELREIVQSIESLRGATVEPFGSFVSNLFTRWGDLDISVELSYGSCISSAGKKHKQTILNELLKALRKKGGWLSIQFIPSARVPILKSISKWQNISCDISIDNLQGQIKSKFLFWLCEIDGRFRDMILLVKEWAKANGINNPKSGTFNSYSLSLLVIFHFQTCVPPILPPLKDIYPTNVVDDLTGTKDDAERRIAQICSSNIVKFRSCRTINRSSLSELFISFIAKFSDINLRASELGICPFTGQWEYIENNMRWLPRTYAIFVEDPFEQPENSARAVSQRQLIKIAEVFQMTRHMLISANLTRSTLLPILVGPQISRFFVNHSASYSSSNGSHYLNPYPHPHPHRSVQSPLQMQQQHRQPLYEKSRPSTSQMQHQAPKVVSPASNMQSQFWKNKGVEWTGAEPSISKKDPFGLTSSIASATSISEVKD